MRITYIIEVSFEFYGAKDWQSVAECIRFPQDLVVERHLSCHTSTRERTMQGGWSFKDALMVELIIKVVWTQKKED